MEKYNLIIKQHLYKYVKTLMETVNRNQSYREPGQGGSPVSVISMEDHSGVSFQKIQ